MCKNHHERSPRPSRTRRVLLRVAILLAPLRLLFRSSRSPDQRFSTYHSSQQDIQGRGDHHATTVTSNGQTDGYPENRAQRPDQAETSSPSNPQSLVHQPAFTSYLNHATLATPIDPHDSRISPPLTTQPTHPSPSMVAPSHTRSPSKTYPSSCQPYLCQQQPRCSAWLPPPSKET